MQKKLLALRTRIYRNKKISVFEVSFIILYLISKKIETLGVDSIYKLNMLT